MLAIGLLSTLLFPAVQVKEKDLPRRHQEFLNLTRYIMLKQEKDVFMKLTSDRDRDIFISAFWKQRDPTPGTPKNEYKSEHIRRFNHANKFFARGATRQGWRTDMGRIYILLGEPMSIERFETEMGIRPAQAWSYRGDTSLGLPNQFTVLFFKRSGIGEWQLYDYISDGPSALLIGGDDLDPNDYETLYDKIRELSPTLTMVAFSMIPGDIPVDYRPTPMNNIIMASIYDSPKKKVNPVYATHFLEFKGIVSSDYMTNYIENVSQVKLIRDPLLGIDFLHFSIAPQTISVDYYKPKDQYFCNFKVSASLRLDDQHIIFQYSKDFPFYFSPDELSKIQGNGLAIEDSFPVVPGKYKLIVLLQNSVKKEFTLLEKEIAIPEMTGLPRISGFYLGYKIQNYKNSLQMPFKVLNQKLIMDPSNTFSSSDRITYFFNIINVDRKLWENGKVRVKVKGLKPNNPLSKSYTIRLSSRPFAKELSLSQSIQASVLTPDYYEMDISLTGENETQIDNQKTTFIVSQQKAVAHPVVHCKALPMANSFLFFYAQARQYEKIKAFDRAEASYSKAFSIKPDYKQGLLEYSNFLYKTKNFDKILQLIDTIKDDENLKFEYYLLQGKAFMGLERYKDAIDSFTLGNKIYNSSISLLNSLGFCYYKIGDKENALNALNASLKLNSGQANVKKLIAQIGKSGK